MNTVLVADARNRRKSAAPAVAEVELPCGRRAMALSWDRNTVVAVYVEPIREDQPGGVCDRSRLWGTSVMNAVKKWTRTLPEGSPLIRCTTEEVLDAAQGAL